MFWQLDSLDKILNSASDPLLHKVVQTDHRLRSEVEAEEGFSRVVAVGRLLNARRHFGDDAQVKLSYAAPEIPPDFLQEIVVSFGGRFEIYPSDGKAFVATPEVEAIAPEDVIRSAFEVLAEEVTRGRERTVDGLQAFELEVAEREVQWETRNDHPIYWRTVLSLSAYAGAVLTENVDGYWAESPMDGHIPFSYRVTLPNHESWVNLADKAQSFVAHGQEDSVAFLVKSVLSQAGIH